ncbi:hypothetical protein O4H29_07075 [Marinobacter salarius]|uniref:hypothetical protein n=1 Tax=Marinobacter salarius TaxID=1420917 RepID=UPI0022B0D36E|nr:hypothetical protein [Marinobacter salarius]MCZ4284596.1 hypothetical protein [Marinobacter salarius]
MSDASDYRWNFEEGVHGRALRCTNDHPKGYPCEYEPLATEEAESMADLIAKQGAENAALRQKLEHAEARADACQQQAQIWKQEARTQSAIVAEIYQELTGKTGEHGDWNGGRPLRAEILRKQAEKLDEIAAHIKEAAEAGLSSVASIYEGLKLNSSSLRQQADEIESGGGDE